MRYEFLNSGDVLVIKLSGVPSPNERLLTKKSLILQLLKRHRRVIVDLSDLKEHGGAYLLGILNTIRKEVQIMGGEMKLCALGPRLFRYFQENRLFGFLETRRAMEQAKRSFRKGSNETNN
jgi:anti-anti-sigma regulatory factor